MNLIRRSFKLCTHAFYFIESLEMVCIKRGQRNTGLCFREKNTIKNIIDSLGSTGIYVVEDIKILYQCLTY